MTSAERSVVEVREAITIRKPDGTAVELAPQSEYFTDSDRPGVYAVTAGPSGYEFAVNVDPQESRTTPLEIEKLEQLGCRMANPAVESVDREHTRQMREAELENRQKLWQWLILTAACVLVGETWLASRLSRTQPTTAEASAP